MDKPIASLPALHPAARRLHARSAVPAVPDYRPGRLACSPSCAVRPLRGRAAGRPGLPVLLGDRRVRARRIRPVRVHLALPDPRSGHPPAGRRARYRSPDPCVPQASARRPPLRPCPDEHRRWPPRRRDQSAEPLGQPARCRRPGRRLACARRAGTGCCVVLLAAGLVLRVLRRARLPARAAVHRHDEVPVQRLSGGRPGRLQGAAEGHPRGRRPEHGRRGPAPARPGDRRHHLPDRWSAAAHRAGWPRSRPRRCCSTPTRSRSSRRSCPTSGSRRSSSRASRCCCSRRSARPRLTRSPAGAPPAGSRPRRRHHRRARARRVRHDPAGRRDPAAARPALPAGRGRRLADACWCGRGAFTAAFAIPIGGYMAGSYLITGHFWLASSTPSISSYGRMATAADCAHPADSPLRAGALPDRAAARVRHRLARP